MKKYIKAFLCFLLLAGLMAVCGITTSCASSYDGAVMHYNNPSQGSSKVINSNYKVKGNNRTNGATYRSY